MPRLRIAMVLLTTFLLLRGLFAAEEWYAERVALPRYCQDREETVARVARILHEARPAAGEPTRAYVIAAKLIYLVPQRAGESDDAYLARLRREIRARCA